MSPEHNIAAEQVWLAPMSGSTDAAFRRQVVRFGGPAVVSEMVAGEALRQARPDVVRRTCRHEGTGRWIVQLAARRPEDMKEGARILADLGVDMIDINMGCPARQVTGGRSGSALMREPDLAERIMVAAREGAGDVPVSLKMRLGWDNNLLNAPELAARAEALGLVMVTVHGRTRCQFYKGQADWAAIAHTRAATRPPLIANGDITSAEDARAALARSGADGVMIGRAALGQPWLIGGIADVLAGRSPRAPGRSDQLDSLVEQIEDSLDPYSPGLGLRIVRKHVAASINRLDLELSDPARRTLRAALCRLESPKQLIRSLTEVYQIDPLPRELAA